MTSYDQWKLDNDEDEAAERKRRYDYEDENEPDYEPMDYEDKRPF